jgi:hypothetical protein
MATYIEMRTDGFARNLDAIVEQQALDFQGVRRPLRGIEIKDDTYSIIKVIRSNGTDVPLVDSGAPMLTDLGLKKDEKGRREVPPMGATFNYSNFIAQTVIDSRSEKQQVVETFGEPFIFFYGEKPRILNVQGLLMNTVDFNWKNEFWKNYENYLRGTKLVEMDARIYFYFDDQIVEGYMLDASAQHDAQLPYHVPFQFTLFVTAHDYIGMLDDTPGLYPVSANVDVPVEDLREAELFAEKITKLRQRKDKLRPDTLISTTQQVAAYAELAAGGEVGKQAIMSAIIRGLSDYEAKVNAFLSNVKTYFYGRRMIVPKGISGAEIYSGDLQKIQGSRQDRLATGIGRVPERTLPIRSFIAENVDEYIGGYARPLPKADMQQMADQMELTPEEYEMVLLSELAQMGVDITEPTPMQNWRRSLTNSITKTADKIDFSAGLARGAMGSLAAKGQQIYSLASSVPGMLTTPATALKAASPVYIP